MLRRLVRKPSLHFWLLGALLFIADRWVNQSEQVLTVAYPDSEQIAQLRQQWLMSTGRPPEPAELERMVQYELDQEILLSEALRLDLHLYDSVVQQRLLRDMRFMGGTEGLSEAEMLQQAYAMDLHINDTVVKRRLMQAMESIYRAPGEARKATRQELEQIYRDRLTEFTIPESRRMSHVFVSSDRHGADAAPRAQRLYDSFTRDQVGISKAQQSTDPFLSGLNFALLSARQLSRYFGQAFADDVFDCAGLGWCGPLASPYGWHLVFIHEQEEPREQSFEAVEDKLRYYFKREQGDLELEQTMQRLRMRYQVVGAPVAGDEELANE